MKIITPAFILIASALFLYGCSPNDTKSQLDARLQLKEGDGLRWYKGQTHTHTLWSDGDAPPDFVVNWYKERDYDFIAITDHNVIPLGDRWVPVGLGHKVTPHKIDDLKKQLGKDWVETRERNGNTHMRLKTIYDLKDRFDEKEVFELVWGEEITSITPQIHVNGINVRETIKQAGGRQPKSWGIRENIKAVNEQSARLDIPMFAHLDHPNWNQAMSVEDIYAAGNIGFFEVYNGHAGVRNWGREELHLVSTDRLWDILLTLRLSKGERIVYGVATDDAHSYYEMRVGNDNPFRGWCMVLASELTSEAIVNAYKTGNFYMSTGVLLDEIKADDTTFTVAINAQDGVTYTTQFIGTKKGVSTDSTPTLDANGNPIEGVTRQYDEGVGEVLFETTDNPAVYTLTGDELYVRAKIVSDTLQDNPHANGDLETAWTQPLVPE